MWAYCSREQRQIFAHLSSAIQSSLSVSSFQAELYADKQGCCWLPGVFGVIRSWLIILIAFEALQSPFILLHDLWQRNTKSRCGTRSVEFRAIEEVGSKIRNLFSDPPWTFKLLTIDPALRQHAWSLIEILQNICEALQWCCFAMPLCLVELKWSEWSKIWSKFSACLWDWSEPDSQMMRTSSRPYPSYAYPWLSLRAIDRDGSKIPECCSSSERLDNEIMWHSWTWPVWQLLI